MKKNIHKMKQNTQFDSYNRFMFSSVGLKVKR